MQNTNYTNTVIINRHSIRQNTGEDLAGIGYFLPERIITFRVAEWKLQTLTYVQNGIDIQHIDWWETDLVRQLLNESSIQIDDATFDDIKLRYTGLPRVRIKSYQVGNVLKHDVFNGNNLNAEMKSLLHQYLGDNMKLVYDDHEIMDKEDKDVIQFVLNLTEFAY
jgi:hypothetical protein